MVIGIDIRMLARGARTGIEEYTVNLFSKMLCLENSVRYKLFYNGYKKVGLNYEWLKLPNVELMQYKIPNRLLDVSSRFFSYPKIDKLLGEVDVFFSPHIFLSSISKNCPTIITFHDLSFERHPEFYSSGKNYWHFSMSPKNQARKATKIIAVSESTKNDLVELYGINPEKIKVIYSGVGLESGIWNYGLSLRGSDSERSNPVTTIQRTKSRDCFTPHRSFAMTTILKKVKKKYNLPYHYILYLGTLEPRKNIVGLIKAFEKFKIQNSKFKLVIAGSKGWLYNDIFKTAKKSKSKDDIIFTGFVDDKDKAVLYSLAELFVYPSFYEGFGFPPLEAMACGTPVITSNFSSLPEAVEDAAITVNPYNIDELSRAMKMTIADGKLRSILIEKGFEQVKKFSWQKCAEETLQELKSAK